MLIKLLIDLAAFKAVGVYDITVMTVSENYVLDAQQLTSNAFGAPLHQYFSISTNFGDSQEH